MDPLHIIIAIQNNVLYRIALFFFAAYPIVMSLVWITTSFFFRSRWETDREERKLDADPSDAFSPFVSILIPVYN